MTYCALILLTSFLVFTNSKSLDKSEKIVIKRADNDDLFPDWVPFKNKNGDQLGDFVDVEPKKIKKRLALPKNFILRAIAEADNDDYYDRGQGDSDADDYEKREWADLGRSPQREFADLNRQRHKDWSDVNKQAASAKNVKLKQQDLMDIDGLSSVSKGTANIANRRNKSNDVNPTTTEQPRREKNTRKTPKRFEYYPDYEEPSNSGSVEKQKPESNDDDIESETKKTNILDSVDELKEKHAQEQKVISEKLKDEAMFKEERDREFGSVEDEDKYNRKTEKKNDYDDYEDKEISLVDKYKMNPLRKPKPTTTTSTTTTTRYVLKRRKEKISKDDTDGNTRLSVFKNPSVYMVYDDDDSGEYVTTKRSKKRQRPKSTTPTTTTTTTTTTTMTTELPVYVYKPISSTHTSSTKGELDERISLVPNDSEKEGEPTLFFPKKRKNKRRNKTKGAKESDSFVAESHDLVPLKTPYKPIDSYETTGPDTLRSPETTKASSEKTSDEEISPNKAKSKTISTISLRPVTESSESLESVESKEDGKDGSESLAIPILSPTKAAPASLISSKFEVSTARLASDPVPQTSAVSAPSSLSSVSAPSETTLDSTASEFSSASAPSSPSGLSIPTGSSESDSLSIEPVKPTQLSVGNPLSFPSAVWVSTEPADAESSPSEKESLKEEKKHQDHEYEKGGGNEHHSEHESTHGESGKKAYEGEHKNSKTTKGHHDKEDHLGKYNDHGGIDKHHYDEKKHFGDHHHEEHGKKHAEYEESGKHSKGHSTKGSHDIHKKEEYEKKVEFFEEEGDSAEEEKHGGHTQEREHHKGGQFKKDNLNAGYHDHAKGDSGHFDKGHHKHIHRGHSSALGHDQHKKQGAQKFATGAAQGGKKWIYHHGYPAKNANLVVIDRRSDQYYHGPQYYG